MAEDYAKATAAPRPIRIGGADYRVGKYNPRDLGDLTAWLKSVSPDPRLKAKELCAGLPDAVALEVWRELSDEARDWPPGLTSYEGNNLLVMTYEGNVQVIWVSLRRHNPGFTMEHARKMAQDITLDEINELIRLGFPEPTFDPKSTPGATTDRSPVPA